MYILLWKSTTDDITDDATTGTAAAVQIPTHRSHHVYYSCMLCCSFILLHVQHIVGVGGGLTQLGLPPLGLPQLNQQ